MAKGLFSDKELRYLENVLTEDGFEFESERDERQTKYRTKRRILGEAVPFLSNHIHEWEVINNNSAEQGGLLLDEEDRELLKDRFGELTDGLADLIVEWLPNDKVTPFLDRLLARNGLSSYGPEIMDLPGTMSSLNLYFSRLSFADNNAENSRLEILRHIETIRESLASGTPLIGPGSMWKQDGSPIPLNKAGFRIEQVFEDEELIADCDWLMDDWKRPYTVCEPRLCDDGGVYLFIFRWPISNDVLKRLQHALDDESKTYGAPTKEEANKVLMGPKDIVDKNIKILTERISEIEDWTPLNVVKDIDRFGRSTDWGGGCSSHLVGHINRLAERDLIGWVGKRVHITLRGYRAITSRRIRYFPGTMQTQIWPLWAVGSVEEAVASGRAANRRRGMELYLKEIARYESGSPDAKIVGLTNEVVERIYQTAERIGNSEAQDAVQRTSFDF